MNMYLHELRSLRKSAVIWTCALVALAAMYLCVYPGIASDTADFKKLLDAYPAPVRHALGLSINSLTSLLGFYSMVFTFITLCGAIEAMMFGASVITRETRERTADFLFTRPVSRASVIGAKLLAAVTVTAVGDLVYFAASALLATAVRSADFSMEKLMLINLTLFFVQLVFLALGTAAAVLIPGLKSVLPLSLGTVFGFYFIGMILSGKNDAARFFSPFKYFDNMYIINHAGYEVKYLIAVAVIVAAGVSAAFAVYTKKDVHAV